MDYEAIFCQARRLTEGMIDSFQGKATQHGGKSTARRVLRARVDTI